MHGITQSQTCHLIFPVPVDCFPSVTPSKSMPRLYRKWGWIQTRHWCDVLNPSFTCSILFCCPHNLAFPHHNCQFYCKTCCNRSSEGHNCIQWCVMNSFNPASLQGRENFPLPGLHGALLGSPVHSHQSYKCRCTQSTLSPSLGNRSCVCWTLQILSRSRDVLTFFCINRTACVSWCHPRCRPEISSLQVRARLSLISANLSSCLS